MIDIYHNAEMLRQQKHRHCEHMQTRRQYSRRCIVLLLCSLFMPFGGKWYVPGGQWLRWISISLRGVCICDGHGRVHVLRRVRFACTIMSIHALGSAAFHGGETSVVACRSCRWVAECHLVTQVRPLVCFKAGGAHDIMLTLMVKISTCTWYIDVHRRG